MKPLYESSLKSLPRIGQGKVRDIYAVGGDKMLIVTSDRLSAFDVVLTDPIPDKGRVLNEMASFWFERLRHIVPNQLTGVDPESVVAEEEKPQVRGRSMVVKKLKPLPIEAVVRGYIIGSGWKDYQKTGKVCGIELPKGLRQAEKLAEPIFTPATKAESGHDENISFAEVEKLIGRELAASVRDISIRLYEEARELCRDFEGGVTFRHVRREQNKRADALCNEALDGKRRPLRLLGRRFDGLPQRRLDD